MNSLVLLAHENAKLGQYVLASGYYQQVLTICKTLYGEFNETTAYSMVQLADSYAMSGNEHKAINQLENAGLILIKLEV